jgi:probable addiction module antidote protein
MPRLGFREDLLESLKDPEEAQGYLEAALADGDAGLFLEALKDVAEAQGGVTKIARQAKLHRTGLYRFFSPKGNPTYRNLRTVMDALGFRFRLERKTKRARPRARR